VASAVYNEKFQKSMRLPNDTSIFTPELYGMIEAINYGANIPEQDILILTDSRSSIQAKEKSYPTNTLVREIQNNIRNSDKNFIFCWVPSHIGIHSNEEADKLAVQATIRPIVPQYQYTRSDAKAYIRRTYKEKWKQNWSLTQPSKLREIIDSIYTHYQVQHMKIVAGKDA